MRDTDLLTVSVNALMLVVFLSIFDVLLLLFPSAFLHFVEIR